MLRRVSFTPGELDARRLVRFEAESPCSIPRTLEAPQVGSPLPHLHWDRGSLLPHLHRDSGGPVQDEPFQMNDAAQFIFKRKHLHMFNRCLNPEFSPPIRTLIAVII